MRFHMGVSFSWRTLKKFIIPILLGFLAYLGFNGVFDNFNIPLGFIKVNALENYDTTYTIDFPNKDFFDLKIDDNITFIEFVENLSTIESNYYNIIVSPSVLLDSSSNYIYGFTIHFIDKSYSSLNYSFYGSSSSFIYHNSSISTTYYYLFDLYKDKPNDIYNYSVYLDFYSCYTSNICSNYKRDNGNQLYGSFLTSSNNNNVSSSVLLFHDKPNFNYSPYIFPSFIYYSSVPLVFVNSYNVDSNSVFYKTLIFNGNEVKIGDYIPTYYEYLKSLPSDEDNPLIEDETIHKKLFSKIYWFDDSNTEKGILSSIYILLFLYCLTMILFKIATLLKNKRW